MGFLTNGKSLIVQFETLAVLGQALLDLVSLINYGIIFRYYLWATRHQSIDYKLPANTQTDGASTLLALQGPISSHLHRRDHPLRRHNSVFISLIMAFIFRYYLWAMHSVLN